MVNDHGSASMYDMVNDHGSASTYDMDPACGRAWFVAVISISDSPPHDSPLTSTHPCMIRHRRARRHLGRARLFAAFQHAVVGAT
jgi:hypothetical protein